MGKQWVVYILRCGDGSLYTGITCDLQRRIEQHEAGIGAKYTRGRGPLQICYQESTESYSQALRREYSIKQLTRRQKLELIESNIPEDS